MTDTSRGGIIDRLLVDLAAINGSSPYTSTVAVVDVSDRVEAEIPGGETPWIGISEGEEIYERNPSHFYMVTFPFDLKLVVAGTSKTNVRSQLNDLLDDVFHVLHADPSRNSEGHDTYVTGTSPAAYIDGDAYRAFMTISCACRYTRGITVTA